MTECPLCSANFANDTAGDELFYLHLINLHGMDEDNAQDILGRSMEANNTWDMSTDDDLDLEEPKDVKDDSYYDHMNHQQLNSDEVDFETMQKAEQWWDNKFVQYGSKPWGDQNIAERRTTINAYLRRKQNGWGEVNEADPCWDGYKQIGMKEKNGKQVPNCVPESNESKATEAWKCDVCGKYLGSSDNATKHEQETGHYDMGFTADLSGDSKLDALDEAIDLDDISHLNPDQCIKCGEDAYWHTPEGSVSWNSHQYVPKSSVSGESAYGFSKPEWDAFSDDTKKSIQAQMGVDQPEINITEYGTGDESNALGNYKDKEIIDQMQSEESMCDSCLDKSFENLATEEDLDWITMKGTHIPIRDGQDKKSAVDDFLDDKGKSSAPKTEEPKTEEPKKEIDWDSMSVQQQIDTRNNDKWNMASLTKGRKVKPISKQDTEKSFKKYPDGAYSWNGVSDKDKMEALSNLVYKMGWDSDDLERWENRHDLSKVQFSELPVSMQKRWDRTYKKFVKDVIASGDGFVNSMPEYIADRDARNTSTLNDLYDTTGGQDNTVDDVPEPVQPEPEPDVWEPETDVPSSLVNKDDNDYKMKTGRSPFDDVDKALRAGGIGTIKDLEDHLSTNGMDPQRVKYYSDQYRQLVDGLD